MRTLAFTLAIAVGALGASSGITPQGGREPGPPTEAHIAYGRLAGFYRLVDGARRGYLAYDPAGYVSVTTQVSNRQTPAAVGGYTAYYT